MWVACLVSQFRRVVRTLHVLFWFFILFILFFIFLVNTKTTATTTATALSFDRVSLVPLPRPAGLQVNHKKQKRKNKAPRTAVLPTQ